MLFCSIIGALLEGGTIGLLLVALKVLMNEDYSDLLRMLGGYKQLISEYFDKWGSGGVFVFLVAFAIILQILKSGLLFLGTITTLILSKRVQLKAQEELTKHIFSVSYSHISNYQVGQLSSFFAINQRIIGNLLKKVLNQLIVVTTLTIVYVFSVLSMSVPLTLLFIILASVMTLLVSQLILKVKDLGTRTTALEIETNKTALDYLNAPKLIRVLSGDGVARAEIAQKRLSYTNCWAKKEIIGNAVDPVIEASSILTVGIILIIGQTVGGSVLTEFLPLVMVFLFVVSRLMPQVRAVNSIRMALAGQTGDLESIGKFLFGKSDPFVVIGSKAFHGLKRGISFESVSFQSTSNEGHQLKDVTFSMPKGTATAIIGPSGAGKTTLASLILRLYDPTNGLIKIDNIPLTDIALREWLAKVGVVLQEPTLFYKTIRENILFGREGYSQEDVIEAATAANADQFITKLDNGYDTVVGGRSNRLSGGESQRVALARALLGSPNVLVLDEATNSLDEQSAELVMESLLNLKGKVTSLFITHDLSFNSSFDQVVKLEAGCVVSVDRKF